MKTIAFLAAVLVIAGATPSTAAVITSLPGGEAVALPAVNKYNGHCCITHTEQFDRGVFTSTSSNLWGYTAPYNLSGGPAWEGSPAAIAYSTAQTVFNFAFDAPVASILADFTWGDQNDYWEPLTISVFDTAGNLLESLILTDNGVGHERGKFGFSRGAEDIARLQISGSYYGIRDITTSGLSSAVPEPATWAMMILGFGSVGYAMRRTRRRAFFATT